MRVVITGVGPVTCIGIGKDTFTQGLRDGKDGTTPLSDKFPTANGKPLFAGQLQNFAAKQYLDAKTARSVARNTQFALVGAQHALEDALLLEEGKLPENAKTQICLGVSVGGVEFYDSNSATYLSRGPQKVSPRLIPALMPNAAAAHIAERFGIHGRVKTVNTACGSSTDAIIDSFYEIKDDRADIVITGGAEATITPLNVAGFYNMGALSRGNKSRPFDMHRDGFVIAEGAGILVLESYNHAVARGVPIYAEIAGVGNSCDAMHITAPDETGTYLAHAITQAMTMAGSPALTYINAHGTSTPLNDKVETKACVSTLGDNIAPITSTKSMVGHAIAASGGIEVIASALSMREQFIPPNINYATPDPDCHLDIVATRRDCPVYTVLKTASAFGGHNAAMVLRYVN